MKKTILIALVLIFALASVSPAAEDTWTTIADMSGARSFSGGGVIDGKIYVIGGAPSNSSITSSVEMYDPIVDTWTRMADMPSARCYPATCTFDGKIYVFGGTTGKYSSAMKNVYVYDPQIDTWTQKADMPYAVALCGIAVVDDTIYLIGGGFSEPSSPTSTVMAYNPITESWTQKADMPTARGPSACVVDGMIYAIGGADQDWQVFSYKHVDVYDPSTDTWTRKSDMPTERFGLGSCVVNGKIYAIGGWSGRDACTANEVYDPTTDTWAIRSPMQQKRNGAFVCSIGDKIYAIGGAYPVPQPGFLSSAEVYDTGLGILSPDFNGDGIVDSADMCMMVDYWGTDEPLYDIAPAPFGDGIVDVQDLILFSEHLFEDYRMVAQWKLDETEGMIAHDDVGDCDGTCYGGPLWQPADGKVTGALEFDGMNDYVGTDFVQKPADGSFSAFAWIKGGSPGQVIVSQVNRSVGRTVLVGSTWLGTDPSNGRLVTTLMDYPFGPLESQVIITDGQWHHIGLVYALDGLQRRLYVDGIEVAEDTAFVDGVLSDGGLYFGADNNHSATSLWLGLIDDIRIYPMALSSEEIAALVH